MAQFLQRLHRLSLEHRTEILNGCSLAIADASVAIGVPVFYTQRTHTGITEVDGHVLEVVGLHTDDGLNA